MSAASRWPLAALLALALLGPACTDREGQAREAMAGAAREVAKGRKIEAESWTDALVRYEAALVAVQRVRKEFGDTAAGALAAKPTTYVGPVTLGVLENAILPAVRQRAAAEADPLACAAHLAETVAAPLPRVGALGAVAKHAAGLDLLGTALRLVSAAQATAAGLPAGSDAAQTAWGEVADALLAARELDRARELVLTHGLSDTWQRLAIAYTRTGQVRRAAGMVSHSLGGSPLLRASARAEIATTLHEERDPVLVRQLMTEAEKWAREVAPAERPRVGLLLAAHYARQQNVAQADAWLGASNGLRDATVPELDALVTGYRDAVAEPRLLARVHANLATLEAGTGGLAMAEDVTWLANLAYLQARLGEAEPGTFALARARLLADGIAPTGPGPDGRLLAVAHPDATAEIEALLRVSARLLALTQLDPGLGALDDATMRLPAVHRDRRDDLTIEATRLAGLGGKGDRVLALADALRDQAATARALGAAAEAARNGLVVPAAGLHAIIARFDPGAPGLDAAPAVTATPTSRP